MVYVTETAIFRLRAGVEPTDANGSESQTLKQLFSIVAAQPGFKRAYWGVQVEDATKVVVSCDWDDVQSHKDLFNSEDYKPMTALMMELSDFQAALPVMNHTNFTNEEAAIAAREAPITELAVAAIPSNASKQTKSNLEDTVLDLSKHSLANKCTAFAAGWVIEELEHSSAEGGKASRLGVMLGWPSLEDHQTFASKPEAGEIRKKIGSMTLPHNEDTKLFHVKFRVVK